MIHVLGDSHVMLFSGSDRPTDNLDYGVPNKYDCLDLFRTYNLGPILAYRFHSIFRQTNFFFKSWFASHNKDTIIFYVGEIDVRCHLVKESRKQQRSLEDVVQETVFRYVKGIEEIQLTSSDIIVFGPHPQYKWDDGKIRDFHFGTYPEIYEAGRLFNYNLKEMLPKSIRYCSLYYWMMSNKLNENRDYYMDDFHIKPSMCYPFAEKELRRIGVL